MTKTNELSIFEKLLPRDILSWWKKKQHKNYQDEDKKSAINKKLILRLKSLISKWFQLKTKDIRLQITTILSCCQHGYS